MLLLHVAEGESLDGEIGDVCFLYLIVEGNKSNVYYCLSPPSL
jgi:hypothetical protein